MAEDVTYCQTFPPIPDRAPSGKKWYAEPLNVSLPMPKGAAPDDCFLAFLMWKREVVWGKGAVEKKMEGAYERG